MSPSILGTYFDFLIKLRDSLCAVYFWTYPLIFWFFNPFTIKQSVLQAMFIEIYAIDAQNIQSHVPYFIFCDCFTHRIYTTPPYHHLNPLKDTGTSNFIKFTNTQPAFTDSTPKWQISYILYEISKYLVPANHPEQAKGGKDV